MPDMHGILIHPLLSRNMSIVLAMTVLTVVFLLAVATISESAYPVGPVRFPQGPLRGVLDVPMATSGNNVFMAWANNDTGRYNVFFGKSTDGGKTLKFMMISTPNKGHIIDRDTQISASGNIVYVTW